MEELALTPRRQREAERLRDVPVHVPLDVRDRRAAKDIREDPEEVIDDLRSAEIEDVLLPALGLRPAGYADDPIRVRLE